ncbi:MAG: ATP-binding protein [Desulfuromonas sp.]|nr:ATP-binding protein [Desulfuromonas sp.]
MFRNSLITRIVVMNVILLTVGIGVFTAFHYQRDRDNMIEMTTNGAEILMATIENAIFNSKCKGDPARLHQTLAFIANNPSLLSIRIFDPQDGRIANSSNIEEISQQIDVQDMQIFSAGKSSGIFTYRGEEVLSIVKPINSRPLCQQCHAPDKQVLGVLNINYSMRGTVERLAQSSQCFTMSMVFITMLLSFGVATILVRFVRNPIRVIARRMALVEAGDLSVRMVPKHQDEISSLMLSFNSMVEKLATAKEELEQVHFRQLEQADRLASIGEMATGMAHEIKNPLAGISGAVTVLADDLPPDDERRQVVHDILAQIARLNKTATDLLKFGRPGLPQCDYLDINEIVKETLFFVAQHPEAKSVKQVTELSADLPCVWADRKQVQQLLLNIIINALQAMSGGGVLIIQTDNYCGSDTKNYVRIRIIDTGTGLSTEHIEKIFTPFFTTKNQGTGLGLAICKQLVEQNSGKIAVMSTPGKGTTFTIILPAVALPLSQREEDIDE